MKTRNKFDEEGPRIHRTVAKDSFVKYRKNVYTLVDEDNEPFGETLLDDDEDDLE